MAKLSTREFTNSVMLMTMVSAPNAERSKILERILETARRDGGIKTEDQKVYDVRITVNGIELDFEEFAKHANEQIDELVVEAAGDIVRGTLDPKFVDIQNRVETALGELAEVAEGEVRRLLALPTAGRSDT